MLIVISMGSTGCSTLSDFSSTGGAAPGQSVTPVLTSPQDEVLTLLGTKPAEQPIPLRDGETARAEASYFAASGRQCRKVRFDGGETGYAKLACAFPAGWQWVPPILP